MPLLSTMSTGNCVPGTEPASTTTGLAVIVTVSIVPSGLSTQFALDPQIMSDRVCVVGGVHIAGPLLCEAGAPQSASTKRIRANCDSETASLNVNAKTSLASSVPITPPSCVRTADVEVSGPIVAAPNTAASACFEYTKAPPLGSFTRTW